MQRVKVHLLGNDANGVGRVKLNMSVPDPLVYSVSLYYKPSMTAFSSVCSTVVSEIGVYPEDGIISPYLHLVRNRHDSEGKRYFRADHSARCSRIPDDLNKVFQAPGDDVADRGVRLLDEALDEAKHGALGSKLVCVSGSRDCDDIDLLRRIDISEVEGLRPCTGGTLNCDEVIERFGFGGGGLIIRVIGRESACGVKGSTK